MTYLQQPPSLSLLSIVALLSFPLGCDSGSDSPATGQGGDSSEDSSTSNAAGDTDVEPGQGNETWTAETHGSDAEPDFSTVFPNDRVLRLDITIDPDQWAVMQDDLMANHTGDLFGGGMSPGGTIDEEAEANPIWGEALVAFDGAEWQHVGIRYKGNSSLKNAVDEGLGKFPYKLDFDEWEDTYPSVDDQRFYGFKQLNLRTNNRDETFMREKLANDLFREFGVATAHAAFCEVYLDVGNGLEWKGLYGLAEEVDDTVHKHQFSDPSGNLYKPENRGATFAEGTYSDAQMYAKTNEETTDYADVRALYDALHASDRTTDAASWRARLEAVFSVDRFLKYLAVNQTILNWDTYGVATHNFFLYSDGGVIHWVPWDTNESLKPDEVMDGPLSLSLDEVDSGWPILRYLIDQADYEAAYRQRLNEFLVGPFEASAFDARVVEYKTLIEPYATRESTHFATAVEDLRQHVSDRHAAVSAFLQ